MARKLAHVLVFAALCLTFTVAHTRGGEADLKKQLTELNLITGNEPMRGALKALVDNPKRAKELIKYALPAAQKKELSYNAALVIGLVAADLKDLKSSELFLRVCMEQAAKLQSVEKLKQSYGVLIGLYYDDKRYADAARVARDLLELNTDDDKVREVKRTYVDPFGKVQISEPEDGFKTGLRLRPYIYELYVKSTAKLGRYDQALKLVDNLLKDKGDWIDLHLKGWVYKEAGRLNEAATVYEDVIKQVKKDRRLEEDEKDDYIEQFRYEVSNVYVDLKKIDRASEHLEYLIKKRPDNPSFYNDLGYIWADHDMKLEEAEKLVRKALDLDRERRKKAKSFDPKTDIENGAYLDSLGWVLFKKKDFKGAKSSR